MFALVKEEQPEDDKDIVSMSLLHVTLCYIYYNSKEATRDTTSHHNQWQ